MDSRIPLGNQRRAWRALFFSALALFLVFWLWMLVSAAMGRTPFSLARSLFSPYPRGANPASMPVSHYLENGFGVRAITPADNKAASVNENGRRIVISFEEPMESDATNVVTGWDIHTEGNGELGYRNFSWPDAKTFVISLNRDLGPLEHLSLTFRFCKAGGEPLPPITVTYR